MVVGDMHAAAVAVGAGEAVRDGAAEEAPAVAADADARAAVGAQGRHCGIGVVDVAAGDDESLQRGVGVVERGDALDDEPRGRAAPPAPQLRDAALCEDTDRPVDDEFVGDDVEAGADVDAAAVAGGVANISKLKSSNGFCPNISNALVIGQKVPY